MILGGGSLRFIFVLFCFMCMSESLHVCVCYLYEPGANRGHNRDLDPLELELKIAVIHPILVLGTESQSFSRVASTITLNHLSSSTDIFFMLPDSALETNTSEN